LVGLVWFVVWGGVWGGVCFFFALVLFGGVFFFFSLCPTVAPDSSLYRSFRFEPSAFNYVQPPFLFFPRSLWRPKPLFLSSPLFCLYIPRRTVCAKRQNVSAVSGVPSLHTPRYAQDRLSTPCLDCLLLLNTSRFFFFYFVK